MNGTILNCSWTERDDKHGCLTGSADSACPGTRLLNADEIFIGGGTVGETEVVEGGGETGLYLVCLGHLKSTLTSSTVHCTLFGLL